MRGQDRKETAVRILWLGLGLCSNDRQLAKIIRSKVGFDGCFSKTLQYNA